MNGFRRTALVSLFLFTSCLLAEPVSGQAYCALRDPVRGVYHLYPEGDRYRTMTATVGPEHRVNLSQKLPFTIHFNEFGRHSLYQVFQSGRTAGIIHVRSERGRWGLVEICWALDLDMKVLGFQFQRCRDPQASKLMEGTFPQKLKGMGFEQLKQELSLVESGGGVPAAQQALATTILKSGLKTIALTEDVWRDELNKMRARPFAEMVFGSEAVSESSELQPMPGPEVGFKLEFKGEWAVRNKSGDSIGTLILTSIDLSGLKGDLWWAIDSERRLKRIDCQGGWPDERSMAAFKQLESRRISDFSDCATAAELAAEAVLEKQESP